VIAETVRLTVRRAAQRWSGKKPVVQVMLRERLTRMKWTSIAGDLGAVLGALAAFLVMPFGVPDAADEVGIEEVPGQAPSAPANFNPRRILLAGEQCSRLRCFWLYYANYVNRWITIEDLDIGPLLGL